MIVSSELNDIEGIRNAAKNTFLTVGLPYGKYLNEFEIVKRSFELLKIGADAIYCPQVTNLLKQLQMKVFQLLVILASFHTSQLYMEVLEHMAKLLMKQKKFMINVFKIARCRSICN